MKVNKLLLPLIILTACGGDPGRVTYQPASSSSEQCQCLTKTSAPVIKKSSAPAVIKTPQPEKAAPPEDKKPGPVIPKNEKKGDLTREEAAVYIYKKCLENIAALTSFKTTVYNYTRGRIYLQEPVKEIKIGISTNQVVFQRPRKMLLNIKESVELPEINNTRLYFDGSDQVKIKVPGILGIFTFTFPVTKPELSNYRGYTAQDIDTVSLEKRLNNPAAKVKLLGISTIQNQDIYMIEISGIEKPDPLITRELLGLRKTDYLPVVHELYEGNTLVYQDKFENFTANIPLTEADFKL